MSQQSSTLRSIDLSKTYEPLEALAVLALDQFLAHNDQMTFASCIEESTQLVAQTSRRHYVERMDADWADIRRDLVRRNRTLTTTIHLVLISLVNE